VRLLAVSPPEKGRRYPRIVERKGASPPQYIDWDEEEDESDPAPEAQPPKTKAKRQKGK
jgi:hypothetical protein